MVTQARTPLSVQKVIPSCDSPFTYDFLLCVTSSLSIHPCFFRPSVCPSISLSVSLLSVSRTVRPLKLLVYLSACLSAGISVLMLRCRLHNYCLFARPLRLYFLLSFVTLISANTVEPLMDTSHAWADKVLATSEHCILNLPQNDTSVWTDFLQYHARVHVHRWVPTSCLSVCKVCRQGGQSLFLPTIF